MRGLSALAGRALFLRFGFVLYSLLILYISLRPLDGIDIRLTHLDKLVHFLVYAVMAFLAYGVYRAYARPLSLAFGHTALFGVAIEGLQRFVPARSPSFADVVFNILGSLVALVCIRLLQKR